jgi:hypothetical protein
VDTDVSEKNVPPSSGLKYALRRTTRCQNPEAHNMKYIKISTNIRTKAGNMRQYTRSPSPCCIWCYTHTHTHIYIYI